MKKISSLFMAVLLALSSTSLLAQNYYDPANPSNNATTYESTGINWQTDYARAQQESRQTGKPILLFVTGTGWCTWCTKLEREVLNTKDFAQSVGNRFVFLKADFPDYTEEAIARSPYKPLLDRYNIDSFPTLVAIDGNNGQQIFKMGYQAGGARNFAQQILNKLGNRQNNNMPNANPTPYYR